MENKNKDKFITKERYLHIASWARTVGYFLSMGAFGLTISSLGPILPDLASQVAAPLDLISMIFTVRAAGFFIGAFFGGKFYDRFKGHLFMVVCFLAQSIIIAFIPFITSFWVLLGVLFVSGIALGAIVVGASTFIVWEHAQNPAPWVSTQSFINAIGGFLSPLIISQIIIKNGVYDRAYWIYALIMILLSALFMYVPSPEIRKIKKEKEVKLAQPKILIYLVALMFLLYTGAEVTYNGWVFTMATTAYPISNIDARLLNSFFWGAIAIGRLFGVFLSKRIRSDKILAISFSGAIVSLLLSVILPGSNVILWIATIGAGLFMALIFPTLTLYADKQMGLTGKMTGIFFSATSIGGMLLPWIAGQLFTFINPHMVKVVVTISLVGGFSLFYFVNRQILARK